MEKPMQIIHLICRESLEWPATTSHDAVKCDIMTSRQVCDMTS
jgi:hypothetical protein